MDIFRAGDEGVRRVREADPDAVRDAGTALLRGGAFAIDGYEMYPVARRDVDGGFGMVAVDREGDVVLLEFRTTRATGATVGDALADAAAASRVDYATLTGWYEQLTGDDGGLADAHAAAFDRDRLSAHFEGDVGEILSLEPNTNEVLLRPDHPAYAGGVLRYRLHPSGDRAAAEFRLDVYGGSEVEKERMRAVIRRYEPDLEDDLGYDVDDGYDAAVRSKPLRVADGEFDPAEARTVAEEFERLVGFVHPRVMRAWREATE